MWNLAYSLARSGEHRNYQAIEWELRAFGYPARDNYYTASESVKGWTACASKLGKGFVGDDSVYTEKQILQYR
jgi:hypothetical protein